MSTLVTIQSTDLITNSRADINSNFSALNNDKMEKSVLDTDTTLAANSDTKIPSQKAVKAYVDAGGNVNASTTAKGIVEAATSTEITNGTATGGTGAVLAVTPDALKSSQVPIVRKYENSGSPHTWTKPTGLKYVVVEVQGGGGGGGGCDGAGGDPDGIGGGGGGGGFTRKLIAAASLGTTETVTVGAGGGGGSATATGTTGGTSSFGAHCSAIGGAGGVSGGDGGVGGVGSGGDFNTNGGGGGSGATSSVISIGGIGGSAFFGGGAKSRYNVDGGANASNYGGGGSGASKTSNADSSGGSGANGVCIVTEYYV